MRKLVTGCAVVALVALSCRSMARSPAAFELIPPIRMEEPGLEIGIASWYGEEFHGKVTASGEVYDMNGLTAATLRTPFGSILRVKSLKNQRSLVLRVNDRGPSVEGRIIDVSMGAAKRLGFLGAGLAPVQIELVGPPGR